MHRWVPGYQNMSTVKHQHEQMKIILYNLVTFFFCVYHASLSVTGITKIDQMRF